MSSLFVLSPSDPAKVEIVNKAPTTFWDFMETLIGWTAGLGWMAGLIVAKGFWMTLFSIFPPVAWFVFLAYIIDKVG